MSYQWKILISVPMDECMRKWSLLFAGMLMSGMAYAQPPLRLKGLNSYTASRIADAPQHTLTPGRSHWLLQFAHNPSGAELKDLAKRGATVLSYVPDFAFSLSVPDGISWEGLDTQWMGRLRADEKMSAEFGGRSASRIAITAVVELYPDVDPNDGRLIAKDAGLRVLENPDLLPNHLLVRGNREELLALAGWDEVSYIFPASKELTDGMPVHACTGALASLGSVEQAIPLIGDGWDGPGLGAASLNYAFDNVTAQLPAAAAEAEIVRAFSEWAGVVQVTFTPSNNPDGDQTIAVLFATGAHGDGYPFVGTAVVGHTFYPFPVNPEPIAGDMHFNDAQTWQIGSGIDLFSVALHQTGHALGLGHSDVPGDVMYPYYRMHTVLMPDDIAAVQELYAAVSAAPSPSPAPAPEPDPASGNPLLLAVIAPPSSTTASSISISGTVSGGTGSVQVSWTSSNGTSGTAQGSSNWIIPTIPLSAGSNVITITAADSLMNLVTCSVTVSDQPTSPAPSPTPSPNPPAPNPPPSPNPPSGPDTTPPSLTILSPATNNYSTSASTLVVSGTATDNVGVTSVTWATSNGDSGTASGTTNWSTSAIPFYIGATTIIITAADAAGNTSWRSLTVTRD